MAYAFAPPQADYAVTRRSAADRASGWPVHLLLHFVLVVIRAGRPGDIHRAVGRLRTGHIHVSGVHQCAGPANLRGPQTLGYRIPLESGLAMESWLGIGRWDGGRAG